MAIPTEHDAELSAEEMNQLRAIGWEWVSMLKSDGWGASYTFENATGDRVNQTANQWRREMARWVLEQKYLVAIATGMGLPGTIHIPQQQEATVMGVFEKEVPNALNGGELVELAREGWSLHSVRRVGLERTKLYTFLRTWPNEPDRELPPRVEWIEMSAEGWRIELTFYEAVRHRQKARQVLTQMGMFEEGTSIRE